MQYVVFFLGNCEYGIPVNDVREVLKVAEIRPLPDVPGYVEGLMTLRKGSLIVVDLRRRLAIDAPPPASPARRIIVVKGDALMMGLLVDGVRGIIEIDPKAIDLTGQALDRCLQTNAVKGVAHEADKTILLMDLSYLSAVKV